MAPDVIGQITCYGQETMALQFCPYVLVVKISTGKPLINSNCVNIEYIKYYVMRKGYKRARYFLGRHSVCRLILKMLPI